MLKSVLSGETCGKCRNCCVFFSKSRWEMPSIAKENAKEIKKLLGDYAVTEIDKNSFKLKSVIRENLPDNCEEYKCPALDESKGCTLPENLKPIECSMWPLRVMKTDDKIYITLAGGCHAVDEKFIADVTKLLKDGLYDKITDILKNDKSIIREYDSSYQKLMEITGEI